MGAVEIEPLSRRNASGERRVIAKRREITANVDERPVFREGEREKRMLHAHIESANAGLHGRIKGRAILRAREISW